MPARDVPSRRGFRSAGPRRSGRTQDPAVLDEQSIAEEIEPVLASVIPIAIVRLPGPRHSSCCGRSRPAPSRPFISRLRRRRMTVDAVERIERADQHRRRRSVRLGHDVHQRVDAVVQIHVGMARSVRTAARCGGSARRRVAGGVGFADVGLDLNDDAAGPHTPGGRGRGPAEQVARDVESRPIVEGARRVSPRPQRTRGNDPRQEPAAGSGRCTTPHSARPAPGVPVATTGPPSSPPSGPRSMM